MYKTKLWRFKTSNPRWTCNHWIPNKNRLKFDNFFGICAHFALKCDLPPIVRGMMMHKLEILSKSYFRASDIEAVLTATIYYSFFEKLTHVQCTHATLIKLIYNLQENHIPTEQFYDKVKQAQRSSLCAKVMWILGRKNLYAFSARSPIFLDVHGSFISVNSDQDFHSETMNLQTTHSMQIQSFFNELNEWNVSPLSNVKQEAKLQTREWMWRY